MNQKQAISHRETEKIMTQPKSDDNTNAQWDKTLAKTAVKLKSLEKVETQPVELPAKSISLS